MGSGYQYSSVVFGETAQLAPNTRPDGSDDPDGRALNRRVEIRTRSVEQVPATLDRHGARCVVTASRKARSSCGGRLVLVRSATGDGSVTSALPKRSVRPALICCDVA